MKEDFLHYVWKYRLFSIQKLQTISGETLSIIHKGLHNKNSGPDFLNAKVNIENQLWAGNIEIHIKSSDWYAHNYEEDKNYDAVILHVVWEYDVAVYRQNNTEIPTLVLKDLVSESLLENYQKLFSSQSRWIPCQSYINEIDSFTFSNWKERLFFERLENKALTIHDLFEKSSNNYEAVLFQLLAKNFGLKVNGEAFLQLAKSIDFSIIRKERFDVLKLSALLFGQAGFLGNDIQDEYYLHLQDEYSYIKHKYKLHSISNEQFSFFRMRPHNFPTIRIAQLIALYHKHQNLFSLIVKTQSLEDFYNMFSVEVNNFWKTHYTFRTESKKSNKKLSTSFIDLLLINTIIPLQFLYFRDRNELNEEFFLKLFQQIKPEKNSIISKFSELKVNSENAFDTQSLLELKNSYCNKKKCLECAIGNRFLKN